jgi:hypothetical protein
VSCTGIQSTRGVSIHGTERFLSSPGTHARSDSVVRIACNYLSNCLKNFHRPDMTSKDCMASGLYNKLNNYCHIYNAKTDRERSNIATTETESKKGRVVIHEES